MSEIPRKHAGPDAALIPEGSSVRFCVSDEMVARFAALTGDHSSLHVDEAVARRSAYRRPVVHGMLPVAFLVLLRSFRQAGFRCVPIGMTGQFVGPVFVGDRLTLSAGAGRAATDGRGVGMDFRIVNDASGAVVTLGSITVEFQPAAEPSASSMRSDSSEMLVEPVKLSNFSLEEIEKGLQDRLDLRISDECVCALIDILAIGVAQQAGDDAPGGVAERVCLPNLLSILMYSTSVGVALPGASATFLEFSARVEREVEVGAVYHLEGEVVHRSGGTRIVKKQMRMHLADRPDEIVARGKVAALVNKPSRRMPSMEDLKLSAADWGLDGKVVLVTGASRGIGETIAKSFALHGARVIVNYHRGASDAERVVREISEGGGSAIAVGADVSSSEEVATLIQTVVDRYGAVDVLVNNAARDYRPIPFAQLTWAEVQKDLDVIVKGAFLCCQAVIPGMLEGGGGKIINITSVAVDNPPSDQAKYVMAKSALVGLTRSLSIEYAARNIQVNMVVPNFVETDLVAHVQEGFRTKIAQDTPMGRHASPAEVARAVVYLASSHASFTTGQKILVTGGGAPYL